MDIIDVAGRGSPGLRALQAARAQAGAERRQQHTDPLRTALSSAESSAFGGGPLPERPESPPGVPSNEVRDRASTKNLPSNEVRDLASTKNLPEDLDDDFEMLTLLRECMGVQYDQGLKHNGAVMLLQLLDAKDRFEKEEELRRREELLRRATETSLPVSPRKDTGPDPVAYLRPHRQPSSPSWWAPIDWPPKRAAVPCPFARPGYGMSSSYSYDELGRLRWTEGDLPAV